MPKDVFPRYPRAENRLPDGDPLGRQEMSEITGRSSRAVSKWIEREALPPADGPLVHGLPTWRRRTFLAWAYDSGYLVDGKTQLPDHDEGKRWYEEMRAAMPRPVREMRRLGEMPDAQGVA